MAMLKNQRVHWMGRWIFRKCPWRSSESEDICGIEGILSRLGDREQGWQTQQLLSTNLGRVPFKCFVCHDPKETTATASIFAQVKRTRLEVPFRGSICSTSVCNWSDCSVDHCGTQASPQVTRCVCEPQGTSGLRVGKVGTSVFQSSNRSPQLSTCSCLVPHCWDGRLPNEFPQLGCHTCRASQGKA